MPIEVFVYINGIEKPVDYLLIPPGRDRDIIRLNRNGTEDIIRVACNADDLGFTTQVVHPIAIFEREQNPPFAVIEEIDKEDPLLFGNGVEEIIEVQQRVGRGRRQRLVNGRFHLNHVATEVK